MHVVLVNAMVLEEKSTFEKFESDQQARNEFKTMYTADKVFNTMSDSEIEKEILSQENKAIAIKLYRLATEVQSRKLRPLNDLLHISDDAINNIEDNADKEEIKAFFCQRTFGKMSENTIEFEIFTQYKENKNLAFGVHSLACTCGRDLKDFEDFYGIMAARKAQ
jgi:CRISPR/Cas system CSM-associated protein Csm2 small subunit